jgi:hypothetical protein
VATGSGYAAAFTMSNAAAGTGPTDIFFAPLQ